MMKWGRKTGNKQAQQKAPAEEAKPESSHEEDEVAQSQDAATPREPPTPTPFVEHRQQQGFDFSEAVATEPTAEVEGQTQKTGSSQRETSQDLVPKMMKWGRKTGSKQAQQNAPEEAKPTSSHVDELVLSQGAATPREPPTPTPFVEQRQQQGFDFSEAAEKEPTAEEPREPQEQTAVGKSSRPPLARLRTGGLLTIQVLKARNLFERDISQRFTFSFGKKDLHQVYVRVSFGPGRPEGRSKLTIKSKGNCDWGQEEQIMIFVTDELASLSGPELQMLVEVYIEAKGGKVQGAKSKDILLGRATMDVSEQLGQGDLTLPLLYDPKKPPKGEIDLRLDFTPPLKETMTSVDVTGGAGDVAEAAAGQGGGEGEQTGLQGDGSIVAPDGQPAPSNATRGTTPPPLQAVKSGPERRSGPTPPASPNASRSAQTGPSPADAAQTPSPSHSAPPSPASTSPLADARPPSPQLQRSPLRKAVTFSDEVAAPARPPSASPRWSLIDGPGDIEAPQTLVSGLGGANMAKPAPPGSSPRTGLSTVGVASAVSSPVDGAAAGQLNGASPAHERSSSPAHLERPQQQKPRQHVQAGHAQPPQKPRRPSLSPQSSTTQDDVQDLTSLPSAAQVTGAPLQPVEGSGIRSEGASPRPATGGHLPSAAAVLAGTVEQGPEKPLRRPSRETLVQGASPRESEVQVFDATKDHPGVTETASVTVAEQPVGKTAAASPQRQQESSSPNSPVASPQSPAAATPVPIATAGASRPQTPPLSSGQRKALEATHDMAEQVLIRVKEQAASLLGLGGSSGAVRKVLDRAKGDVSKVIGPLQQPDLDQTSRGDGTSPVSHMEAAASPSHQRDATELASETRSPKVSPRPSAPATEGSPAAAASTTSAADDHGSMKHVIASTTSSQQAAAQPIGTTASDAPSAQPRPAGVTLKEIMDAMPADDDDMFLAAGTVKMTVMSLDSLADTSSAALLGRRLTSDESVTRLQASWRGKRARRDLRRQQLQARRIQALVRGHKTRKGFNVRKDYLLRLEAEERVREERQRRMLMNQRELALLRMTPAMELHTLQRRRQEFAARRIQRFVRKGLLGRTTSLRRRRERVTSPHRYPTIPPSVDPVEEEVIADFVTTYHRSQLSPEAAASYRHSPPRTTNSRSASPDRRTRGDKPVVGEHRRQLSALRLADLHQRVMSTSQARTRKHGIERFESVLSQGLRSAIKEEHRVGAQLRYQRLLESRYQARVMLAERQEQCERKEGNGTERCRRVTRVRELLDQLESPPSLQSFREAFGLEADDKGQLPPAQHLKAVPEISLPWRLPRTGTRQATKLAEDAHKHTLETMREGIVTGRARTRWWVVSLPEDPATPPVDIREVEPPSPFSAPPLAPGLDSYEENESSLWWYAYSRQDRPDKAESKATPLPVGDLLFHRARVGHPVLRAKCAEEATAQDVGLDHASVSLVEVILKERRRREAAAGLAAAAKARVAAMNKDKEQAAVKVQSVWRGANVRRKYPISHLE